MAPGANFLSQLIKPWEESITKLLQSQEPKRRKFRPKTSLLEKVAEAMESGTLGKCLTGLSRYVKEHE